ncbi:hypothetical protein [Microbacterium tumbae]
MDYAAFTERFVAERFPRAEIAVLAGSTSREERTATSDIDLLLIGDDLFDDASSLAATYAFAGEIFEVFAYTRAGFTEWAERGIDDFRPVIVHMLVEGVPVRSSADLATLRRTWAERLAAGPTVSADELAFRRYQLTDVVDDLYDATDPLERQVLAATAFEKTAELVLLSEGRWIGAGKHLPRRLRALDRARADDLAAPLLAGRLEAFADVVERELERAGGRLQAGFVR